MPRRAGLLLHPTSLPGAFGIGDLGPEAERFCDWAARAGQMLWQVLPVGPTGSCGSPYGCLSAFAGNPLLISPERLLEEDFLPTDALEGAPSFPVDRVDFEKVIPWKEKLLRTSWERFRSDAAPETRGDLERFEADPLQATWLPDWTLFSALKQRFGGREWTAWDEELARREPGVIAAARRDLRDEIAYHGYVQFLFFRQWKRFKEEANRRGILLVGDLPIYMAHDSADVWAHPQLFSLGKDGRPDRVAGVPPDYFSEAGQLWGNPLYRWDRMAEDGFSWWVARFRANLRLADLVRVDHFRGFEAYWEVPASEPTARQGRWVKGPGEKLFVAVREAIGSLPLIAEDLGMITPEVRALREALGLPGMRVLQFAFSEVDSDHLPHRHVPGAVVYTGTHDNDTTRGWFEGSSEEVRARVVGYAGASASGIEWDLIRLAYTSVAEMVVVPLQDAFGLGGEARMNVPGRAVGNWTWRARREDFREPLASRLKRLAELTGRHPLAPSL